MFQVWCCTVDGKVKVEEDVMEKYSTHAERINWKKQARVIMQKRLTLDLPFVKDLETPEAWVRHQKP